MARPQAKTAMGFFPIHPENLALIGQHVAPIMDTIPDKKHRVYVLDPCCGEGAALKQWGEMLGIDEGNLFGVELSASRVETARALLPHARIEGPASFTSNGTRITGSSFSLVYCNPPFDDELGGGRREEKKFVESAHHKLCPGGLLILVLPMTALYGRSYFVEYLDAHFEDIRIFKFKGGGATFSDGQLCRPFNEVVVFARKRDHPVPAMESRNDSWLYKNGWYYGYQSSYADEQIALLGGREIGCAHGLLGFGEEPPRMLDQWWLRPGLRPHTFKKWDYTEEELKAVLVDSPLTEHLTTFTPPPPKRPPMPPGKGHVALLLFGDILQDIVVYPDAHDEEHPDKVGERPHVVRGTSSKIERAREPEITENPDTGAATEKLVISQVPILTIRAVDETGTIYTFGGEKEAKIEAEAEAERHAEAQAESKQDDGTKSRLLDKIEAIAAKLRPDANCASGEIDSSRSLLVQLCFRYGITLKDVHDRGIYHIDDLVTEANTLREEAPEEEEAEVS